MNGLSNISLEDGCYYLIEQDKSKVPVPDICFSIFYDAVISYLKTSRNLDEVKRNVELACVGQMRIDSATQVKLIDTLFHKTVVQRKELVEALENSSSFSIKDFEEYELLMILGLTVPYKEHALFQTSKFLLYIGKGSLVKKRASSAVADHPPPQKKVCTQEEAEIDRRTTLSLEDIEAVLSNEPLVTTYEGGKVDEENLISTFVDYCYKMRYPFVQREILNRFRALKEALSKYGFTLSPGSKETKLANAVNKKRDEVIEQEIKKFPPYFSSIVPSLVRPRDTKAEDFLQRLIQSEVSRKSLKGFNATTILTILQGERIAPFFTIYHKDLIVKRYQDTYGKL